MSVGVSRCASGTWWCVKVCEWYVVVCQGVRVSVGVSGVRVSVGVSRCASECGCVKVCE